MTKYYVLCKMLGCSREEMKLIKEKTAITAERYYGIAMYLKMIAENPQYNDTAMDIKEAWDEYENWMSKVRYIQEEPYDYFHAPSLDISDKYLFQQPNERNVNKFVKYHKKFFPELYEEEKI